DCNALSARSAIVFMSGKCSALIVSGQNVPDSAGVKSVVQRHNRATGISEQQVHALGPQTLQNDVSSSKHLRPSPLASKWNRSSSLLWAAMTSWLGGEFRLLQSNAVSRFHAERQNCGRLSCFRQSTRGQSCRLECAPGFLSWQYEWNPAPPVGHE